MLGAVVGQTGRHQLLKKSIHVHHVGEDADGPIHGGARDLAAGATRARVFSGGLCSYGVATTSRPLPASPGTATSTAACWNACNADANCNFFFFSLIDGACMTYNSVAGTLIPASGTDYYAYDVNTICEANPDARFRVTAAPTTARPTNAPSRAPSAVAATPGR